MSAVEMADALLSRAVTNFHHPQHLMKMSGGGNEATHPVPPQRSLLRCATVALVVLPLMWLLSFVAPFSLPHYATFMPANTVLTHTFVWTIFTQVFVELDWVALVVSLITVVGCLAPAEMYFGSDRIICLCATVLTISSVVMVVVSAAVFRIFSWFWLFQTFSGFLPVAVVCAVVVVHKTQGMDFAVRWSSLSFLRTKHVPFSLLVFAALRDLWSRVLFPTPSDTMSEMDIGSTDEIFEAPLLPMSITSFYVSWWLIRFCGTEWTALSAWFSVKERKPQDVGSSGSRATGSGDSSPAFALAEFFFPKPIQTCVVALSNLCFPVVRVVGLGTDIVSAAAAASSSSASRADTIEVGHHSIHYHRLAMLSLSSAHPGPAASVESTSVAVNVTLPPLPGSSSADADRRRALALAALTARLQQVQGDRGAEQPADDHDSLSGDPNPAEITLTPSP